MPVPSQAEGQGPNTHFIPILIGTRARLCDAPSAMPCTLDRLIPLSRWRERG